MEAFKYHTSNNFNVDILNILEKNSIITIIDSLGRIEYVNDNFCNLLECNENNLLGESLKLLKSPLHTGLVYKNLWKAIKSGHKWNGILSADSTTGKSFWLDTTIIPVKKANTVKYVIIYKDITHLHNENIKLSKSDNRSKVFLENTPLNVFSITKYGKILNANKSFCNVEIENLIGNYIYDYISHSSYENFKNNIDAVFIDKNSKQFETFDYDSNGRKLFYSSLVSPVFNDQGIITSATLCINDVTEYKGINKEEQDSEAKYRLIYQSINVGIIVVADYKGNIVEWNKGAELAFGYTQSQILGRPLTVLTSEAFRKPNIKELLKAIKKIKSNKNADIIEMQCLRKNGEEFPVEFALSSLKVDGKSYYCAMMLDITKRKDLQNKLRKKTKDLELFLYHSAHDLQAPFSSAQGLVNLMKEESNNEKIQSLINMLDTTIHNGRILSNNLADASIISAKTHECKKIDFQEIIDEVLKTLSGSRNFEFIKFNVDVNVTKNFKSKPELVQSIFQNLIQNAIKYSKEPSKAHTPNIDIIVKTQSEELVMMVCDNGPGIDTRSIDKIFDLYYRSNCNGVPGNGLGLYIVKSIIEGLNGKINVKSDVNYGACFEIHLPYKNN